MLRKRTFIDLPTAIVMSTTATMGLFSLGLSTVGAQEMATACPVEGCEVKILKSDLVDGEVAVTLEANFQPDLSKNHLHIWWGENFTIQQVSGNAETVHKVKQGDWHPTDAFPGYRTQGAVSTSVRKGSKTLCVSASDRNHDILDIDVLHCVDVSGLF